MGVPVRGERVANDNVVDGTFHFRLANVVQVLVFDADC